jgi:hypothetical protein
MNRSTIFFSISALFLNVIFFVDCKQSQSVGLQFTPLSNQIYSVNMEEINAVIYSKENHKYYVHLNEIEAQILEFTVKS